MKRHRYSDTLADRLWARVNKSGDCWLWTGPTAPQGWYGHFTMHGKHYGAHRASYELAFGPIPAGLQVLHRCDVPRCVRPSHLFAGTLRENMADASQKGRMHPGEANGLAKLTEAAVRDVRARYTGALGELTQFAREYGVSDGAIRQAVRRQTWRRVA